MSRLNESELAALPAAAASEIRSLRELESAVRTWVRAKSASVGTFSNAAAALEARRQCETAEGVLLELLAQRGDD